MIEPISLTAPAKLNLGLRVVGRRADGYHLLQSLVAFIDLEDRVDLLPAPSWLLRLSGPFVGGIDSKDNLALRAGHLLAAAATVDIAGCAALAAGISLDKQIPVAAGLGGGSADAAAVLLGLNRLWRLDLSVQRLQQIAAPLGADLAVCLGGSAAVVGGIGERVVPVALPELALVIVNPGIPLATREVFSRLRPPYQIELPLPSNYVDAADVAVAAAALGNSLAAPAIELCPTIGAALADIAALGGCRLAQMSGSGATCFGLFDSADESRNAAAELRQRRPSWFVRASRTRKH